MKRWLVGLFLFLFVFVSASVDVFNYEVEGEYVPFYEIAGSVNLSIEDESYDAEIVLSDGGGVLLGDFLKANGADFECSPFDCLRSYSAFSGAVEKSISFSLLEEGYVGFVLTGDVVVLENISFRVSSDFEKGVKQPLSIEFFEDQEWVFDEFSNDFLLKDWGCFNSLSKESGPLIGNSFYCEMIDIGNSAILKIGADVDGDGGELDMVVYPESGFGVSWGCSFDPSDDDGCEVGPDAGEIFSEGAYQVCVGASALTDYRIYKDESGRSCGFAYEDGPEDSVKDYGIFAQGVMYADASAMGELSFGEDYIDAANVIISNRYDGSCFEGCVLPLKISGIAQNFHIYDVNLVYTDNSEWGSDDLVYELERRSARVDFNGTLDLGLLGLVVSVAGEYFAELLGKDLFRKSVKILPAPIVSSVLPLDPPAGVPITFYADIDFSSRDDPAGPDGDDSLSYEWDFGDGGVAESSVPYVVYAYNDLENYTLSLRVRASGNLSSKKNFDVVVSSPEAAVAAGLKSKKSSLWSVRNVVESFPRWYSDDLFAILEIARFEDELARLERAQNNSFDVEDFRDVAVKLYALNIPVVVGSNNFESPFLMTDLDDVDIEPVAIISGSISGGTNEDYANSILVWQGENVDVVVKSSDVFASYWNGEDEDVLSVYSFDVTSRWDRESYFVINKPFSELYFNGGAGARKAGDSTVIILGAGEKKSFDFYFKGGERLGAFASPKLSSIVIEAEIDTDCNYDLICDGEVGENPDNCRSDCKPTGKAWFFFVLGFLFLLVVYTVLQIWYKKHYEAYLFKDAAQLYNLLMYVSNARARGVDDLKIVADLRSRGWSKERVDYVIKKSIGKSVGMVEVIPIERISALLRDWRARRKVSEARSTATRVGQQKNANINKSRARV